MTTMHLDRHFADSRRKQSLSGLSFDSISITLKQRLIRTTNSIRMLHSSVADDHAARVW
jgi:hypothetical protein